jgi:deoxyhypusine synthase
MTSKGRDAILVKSEAVDEEAQQVKGPDFNLPLGLQELLSSYGTIGYQATAFKQAIDIVNKMVSP